MKKLVTLMILLGMTVSASALTKTAVRREPVPQRRAVFIYKWVFTKPRRRCFMAGLKEDLSNLKDPNKIKNAMLSSSPYVLRKAFIRDPGINRLIRAHEKVVPLIEEELRRPDKMNEITLAAYAYILENVKPDAAAKILGPLYHKMVAQPGPFFVNFATHTLRTGMHMPVKPLKMDYSHAEMMETQSKLR